jgi:hypothetical protein
MTRQSIRKNRLVRRVVTALFVSCMALGVPAAAVLGSPGSAGAATAAAAPTDPLGPTIAQLEAVYAATLANTVSAVEGVYYPLVFELDFIDSYCFPTITRYCPL